VIDIGEPHEEGKVIKGDTEGEIVEISNRDLSVWPESEF